MSMETDLAWCAGFFDGEGNINCCFHNGRVHQLQLRISQKDRRVLDRFRRSIINNKILYSWEVNIHGPWYRKNGCVIHVLQMSGSNAFKVFEAMKPYLDEAKLEQGEQAINKWQEGRGHLKVVAP